MHEEAELYNFDSDTWRVIDKYPYGGPGGLPYICDYDMLYNHEAQSYLVIGGAMLPFGGATSIRIAQLKDGVWSDVGRLNVKREVSFCYLLFLSSDV